MNCSDIEDYYLHVMQNAKKRRKKCRIIVELNGCTMHTRREGELFIVLGLRLNAAWYRNSIHDLMVSSMRLTNSHTKTAYSEPATFVACMGYRGVQADSFFSLAKTLEKTISHTQRRIVVFARDLKLKIPLHARWFVYEAEVGMHCLPWILRWSSPMCVILLSLEIEIA